MNKFKQWLKQLLEEFNNVQMQHRLDKLWANYVEEERTWNCLPVVSRGVQQHTAEELTAMMWAEIAGARVIERVVEPRTNPYGKYEHVGMVVKKKNVDKLMAITKRYPTAWRYL